MDPSSMTSIEALEVGGGDAMVSKTMIMQILVRRWQREALCHEGVEELLQQKKKCDGELEESAHVRYVRCRLPSQKRTCLLG